METILELDNKYGSCHYSVKNIIGLLRLWLCDQGDDDPLVIVESYVKSLSIDEIQLLDKYLMREEDELLTGFLWSKTDKGYVFYEMIYNKQFCFECHTVVEPEGGVDRQGCYNYCPNCGERLKD